MWWENVPVNVEVLFNPSESTHAWAMNNWTAVKIKENFPICSVPIFPATTIVDTYCFQVTCCEFDIDVTEAQNNFDRQASWSQMAVKILGGQLNMSSLRKVK